jgi:glycogen debranching enzyme
VDRLCHRLEAGPGDHYAHVAGPGAHVLTNLLSSKRAVLKEDRCFAVSARNGSMTAASPDGHGLWLGDTRLLSEFGVLFDGREPDAVGLEGSPGSLRFEGAVGELRVKRERYVDAGLHERITITNHSSSMIHSDVTLEFAADHAAMLAVRGIVHELPRSPDADVGVVIRPGGRHHALDLGPGESFSLVIDMPVVDGAQVADFDAGLALVRDSYRSWAGECASFETDNPALNELLEQSRDDMRMLLDRYATGIYPTGGMPWFAVPFGRDALFTSSFALPLNPDVARGALRFLAAHQGQRVDARTEEEPGKILHEVRSGEVVERGLWPHILYGTVDATPLFLCVLAETLDWTGDAALFDELWPAAEAALEWCRSYGDKDGDGYLEYGIGVEARNEGWKDSNDSVTNVDGTEVLRPAALCEVQGYLYRGLSGLARKRPALRAEAAGLKRTFNRDFWMPGERFVAQALDGRKRRVEAITSNPGHCLWSRILPPARANAVAQRLVSPDLFSGWGIRTLSQRAINYHPRSYHNGSVWPHDNALAAAGLRSSGFPGEAELVARATLEAGMAYADRRLPELFSGAERAAGQVPEDYEASCRPQNWGAASAFQMMHALLGLEADASRGLLRIAPLETSLWKRLKVTGLHFGGHRLDFSVDGRRVNVRSLPKGIRVETSQR